MKRLIGFVAMVLPVQAGVGLGVSAHGIAHGSALWWASILVSGWVFLIGFAMQRK